MSRRKQAKPLKRVIEDDEDEEPKPEVKNIRLNQPSTSSGNFLPMVARPYRKAQPTPSPPTVASPNALALLEKSLKKFEPSRRNSLPNSTNNMQSGNLGALFNCIGKISSAQSLETDGVASILKCLQCGAGFSIMEQLVKHMQETKHFSNLPKTYCHLMPVERQKMYTASKFPSKIAAQTCLKCGEIPKDMDKHLREVHEIKKKTDWLTNVQIIAGLSPALQSPHIKQLMSLINTVEKQK